ncbi:LysR family transcriptional regulator [Pigmentiphaga aceris]|uniref:LysR family transcriptional regulator n=1 Tax=Pigmentiphaga aceris TaxID=1940612 RepID=A0A5C0B4V3_9BURK|nr:LysR substrate-binding domain-containing protein [Pigmentiphaga aceris]QEI08866.1 LysR family transcriptional regulator [Pigmentiphaga aceris]
MNTVNIEEADLNLLKIFEALYQEGGASRAAVRCGLTQSAVSAALGRLRMMYGDPLFVRTGRGLSPTLRANELMPLIGEALDKCRQSLAMASTQAASYAGRSVAIGLSDDFELAVGARLIDAVARLAPGLRLVFRQTYSSVVADMLMARAFDLGLTSGGLSSRALRRETFGEGTYACLVEAESLGDGQTALSVDDYLQRGHVLISSGGFVGMVDEMLAAKGLQRRVLASSTHFSAVPFLLPGSSAVATIPLHAARVLAAHTSLRLLPCPLDVPRYSIELGWRVDSLRDPAVKLVKAALGELLREMAWR